MISFKDYILESLSKENIKKLKQFINDSNVDDIINVLIRHSNKLSIDGEQYTKFFDLHGLSKLNWGRKNNAFKQFKDLFAENDNLEVFKSIIQNNGIVNIDKLQTEGNIFKDYCGDNKNLNPCGNFIEEAKTIASWTNGGSANVGPAEILIHK